MILYALHHAVKKQNKRTTSECVLLPARNHHPDTGRGKEGRDAAWCIPSEGHHASRLNNVFPMLSNSQSPLSGSTAVPASLWRISLCMGGSSLFDPDIAPQIPQRWHWYTRLYASWMFTRSLYRVSAETSVYERGGDSHRYYDSLGPRESTTQTADPDSDKIAHQN